MEGLTVTVRLNNIYYHIYIADSHHAKMENSRIYMLTYIPHFTLELIKTYIFRDMVRISSQCQTMYKADTCCYYMSEYYLYLNFILNTDKY